MHLLGRHNTLLIDLETVSTGAQQADCATTKQQMCSRCAASAAQVRGPSRSDAVIMKCFRLVSTTAELRRAPVTVRTTYSCQTPCSRLCRRARRRTRGSRADCTALAVRQDELARLK